MISGEVAWFQVPTFGYVNPRRAPYAIDDSAGLISVKGGRAVQGIMARENCISQMVLVKESLDVISEDVLVDVSSNDDVVAQM